MDGFTHMVIVEATPQKINRVLKTTPDIASANPSNPVISFEIDGVPYEANAATNKGKTAFLLKEGGMLPADDMAEIFVDYLSDHRIKATAEEFTPSAFIQRIAPAVQPSTPSAPTMLNRLVDLKQKMPNDRFVSAMIQRVESGARLTPNMVKAIEKIENTFANPAPVDQGVVARIDAVLSRMSGGKHPFLDSLKDQALNGRTLSPKQLAALEKFETPSTPRGTSKGVSLSAFNRMDKGEQRMLVLGPEAQRAIGLNPKEMALSSRLIHAPEYDHPHGIPLRELDNLRTKYTRKVLSHPVLKAFGSDVGQEIIYDMIR